MHDDGFNFRPPSPRKAALSWRRIAISWGSSLFLHGGVALAMVSVGTFAAARFSAGRLSGTSAAIQASWAEEESGEEWSETETSISAPSVDSVSLPKPECELPPIVDSFTPVVAPPEPQIARSSAVVEIPRSQYASAGRPKVKRKSTSSTEVVHSLRPISRPGTERGAAVNASALPAPPFPSHLPRRSVRIPVSFVLGSDGRFRNVKVDTGNVQSDESIQRFIERFWRGTPAERDGQPIPVRMKKFIVFEPTA